MNRMTEAWVLAVIGRDEADIAIPVDLGRVLITGAAGSIGSVLLPELKCFTREVMATDIDDLDVRDSYAVNRCIRSFQPNVILHLAGAKHAPLGEEDPYGVMVTNTIGTFNVLEAASNVEARVVVASTCKAAEPATAYGASKLIAERMALNANAVVARYFNVIETSGNVFEIWANTPKDEALPIANACSRRFITAKEAIGLTLWCAYAAPGRYIIDHTYSRSITTIANLLYPVRQLVAIEPRRGDRLCEPEFSSHEKKKQVDYSIARIDSPHDA